MINAQGPLIIQPPPVDGPDRCVAQAVATIKMLAEFRDPFGDDDVVTIPGRELSPEELATYEAALDYLGTHFDALSKAIRRHAQKPPPAEEPAHE